MYSIIRIYYILGFINIGYYVIVGLYNGVFIVG